MRETTGAVFDTIAQIHLIRGEHDAAMPLPAEAREAYGEFGVQGTRWYQWSLHVLEARLALRRGQPGRPSQSRPMCESGRRARGVSLTSRAARHRGAADLGRSRQCAGASGHPRDRLDRCVISGTWGEYFSATWAAAREAGRVSDGYHDVAQSVSVFELLGERYQAGSVIWSWDVCRPGLARLPGRSAPSTMLRRCSGRSGAAPDLADARAGLAQLPAVQAGHRADASIDGDDAVVRRLVDAAMSPGLLAREGTLALLEELPPQAVVFYVEVPGGPARVIAHAGCDGARARGVVASVRGRRVRWTPRWPGSRLDVIPSDPRGPSCRPQRPWRSAP
jgi:hypothetical protein